MKIAIVVGTRPEILKITPIVRELAKRNIKYNLYFTSQHFTPSMGKDFFSEMNIKPTKQFKGKFDKSKVGEWLKLELEDFKPDIMLVHGDTYSALIGALVSIFLKIPIGHIEAGLRSYNFEDPFPEECIRTLIDSVSNYLFCPTDDNLSNVISPDNKKYFVTGNTIIDLIKGMNIKYAPKKQVLITIHRRENWPKIKEICHSLNKLQIGLRNYNFIFVKHANKKIADQFEKFLKGKKMTMTSPKSYKDFVHLLASSDLVVSDSGGIIEECSYLNIPLAIVRNNTEREETVKNKTAVLVGNDKAFWLKVLRFFYFNSKTSTKACPFGDGTAAKQIIDILEKELK